MSFILPGTLLELHYDACHIEEWREKNDETKKRRPERKGEYKVFQSVIEGQRFKGSTLSAELMGEQVAWRVRAVSWVSLNGSGSKKIVPKQYCRIKTTVEVTDASPIRGSSYQLA